MINVAIGRTANGGLYRVDIHKLNNFPECGKVNDALLLRNSENVVEQCGLGFKTAVIWSSSLSCEELMKKLKDAFDCH